MLHPANNRQCTYNKKKKKNLISVRDKKSIFCNSVDIQIVFK